MQLDNGYFQYSDLRKEPPQLPFHLLHDLPVIAVVIHQDHLRPKVIYISSTQDEQFCAFINLFN